MRRDLNEKIELIKKAYVEDLKSLRDIGKMFGCSAMAIQKVLKRHGYDTSKEATKLQVFCKHCNKEFFRHRFRVRETDFTYCSVRCYRLFLNEQSKKSVMDRAGAVRSRRRMEKYYGPLPEGSIVHHLDGNEKNCHISNLVLLASQTDHIRLHRTGATLDDVTVLFDGSKYMEKEEILERAKAQIKRVDKLLSALLTDFAKYKFDVMKGYVKSKPLSLKENVMLLKYEIGLEIEHTASELEIKLSESKEEKSIRIDKPKIYFFVNGSEHGSTKEEIGFDEIVSLAYGKKAWPDSTYSIYYISGDKNNHGQILVPSQRVSLYSGIRFQVALTGNA